MFERWFYMRAGKTQGPVPIAEAVRLAASGVLQPNDKLWPEDFDPQMAFPASATIDFAALARTTTPAPPPKPAAPAKAAALPDWLSDVEQAAPPRPKPSAQPVLPDWLSDVQVTNQFIVRSKKPAPAPRPPTPPTMAPAPAPRAPSRPKATPASPPPIAAPKPMPIPLAKPVPKSAPILPKQAPIPLAKPAVQPIPLAELVPQVEPVPLAEPLAEPVPSAPTREEMGYDPDTGQILDAEKHRRWQKSLREKTEASPAEGETIYETCLRAIAALQNWADQETTRVLITTGTIETIRNDPEVRRMILFFEPYGPDLVKKLWQKLDFLVDNRRQFYASRP